MKKLMLVLLVVGLLCLQAGGAWAAESNLIAIVDSGRISATSSYFTTGGGGDNPVFETRYSSDYFVQGAGGLGMAGSFTPTIRTQEKVEVLSGFGRFETKAGTGLLTTTVNEETGVVSGLLNMNAVGFGGNIRAGIVSTGLTNEVGLVGIAEGKGNGYFQAGGVQYIMTGTNQGEPPNTTEYFSQHFSVGPGPFQVQVKITFP